MEPEARVNLMLFDFLVTEGKCFLRKYITGNLHWFYDSEEIETFKQFMKFSKVSVGNVVDINLNIYCC